VSNGWGLSSDCLDKGYWLEMRFDADPVLHQGSALELIMDMRFG